MKRMLEGWVSSVVMLKLGNSLREEVWRGGGPLVTGGGGVQERSPGHGWGGGQGGAPWSWMGEEWSRAGSPGTAAAVGWAP